MHLRNLALSYLFLSCTPSFAGQIEDATFHSAALNAPLPSTSTARMALPGKRLAGALSAAWP